jgi:uncharacterized protein
MVVRSFSRAALVAVAVAALVAGSTAVSLAAADVGHESVPSSRTCPPSAVALSFSDGLSKLTYDGTEVGGLSSLAYDRRSASWVSAVDNNGSDPARIWFFRSLTDPKVVRAPLVLKRPDGTAYDGTTSDNEGLAVLPDGDFLVSSETEPSIRIYGRNGVEKSSLPIPARFAVTDTTPDGQATSNATLEGLTITPSGNEVIAAMEGALSGDVSTAGDATVHRFLVYDRSRQGRWHLAKQIAYRAEAGMRIPEVVAYAHQSLVVEEASFSAPTGNAVDLYAVTGLKRARNVSAVTNLSLAPARDIVRKTKIADLVQCPTLGATSLETQANPLLDNYEGMAITTSRERHGYRGISLISDDNFSPTQHTRLLNLAARLP